MGNNSGKEARSDASVLARADERRSVEAGSPTSPSNPSASTASTSRAGADAYPSRLNRGSRPDLTSFLGLGGHADRDPAQPEPRRETRQEREKRKLEKEWEQRKKDRERSLREEHVDGGYLVTLGTYTGTEDFSKPIVRQLMIERRIAPFWRPLHDHEDTWTEHQLVAVARGLPLPPADEIPPEDPNRPSSHEAITDPANSLTVPLASRSHSSSTESSFHPTSHSASNTSTSAPNGSSPSATFFKGRSKVFSGLKPSNNSGSPTDMTPQEVTLPHDPYVNGQPIEALLYQDAPECPICFLYYPPYLNRTRCCDQSICSECFVQIKRPDPHQPEHHGEASDAANPQDSQPPEQPSLEEENMLVSEPAACPFCKQPEFGVTYEPPPFRRGLVYGNPQGLKAHGAASATSSSSSLHSHGTATPNGTSRRRGASLSASSPQVVTTDRVRPDWAKKLSDARSHALRRAAAATALHNAAYVLGGAGSSDGRGLLGRRRRMFTSIGDSSSANSPSTSRGSEIMALNHVSAILAAADREQARGDALDAADGSPAQPGGRRTRSRVEDIEELMMLEAIRLSLAEEENRRKKEERDDQKRLAKEGKEERKREAKEEKKIVKELKKAERAAKKSGSGSFTYSASGNPSTTSGLTASQAPLEGKGKGVERGASSAHADETRERVGSAGRSSSPREDAQRHLEQSRAQIQHLDPSHNPPSVTPAINIVDSSYRQHFRHLSNDSSPTSSFNESLPGSLGARNNRNGSFDGSPNISNVNVSASTDDAQNHETPPGTEPMFNFRSLAAVMGDEGKEDQRPVHLEDAHSTNAANINSASHNRGREDSDDSGESGVSPVIAEAVRRINADPGEREAPLTNGDEAEAEAVRLTHTITQQSDPYDAKHFGDISVLDTGPPPAPRTMPRFPPTNPWANAQ